MRITNSGKLAKVSYQMCMPDTNSATTNKDKTRPHESNINCNPVKKKEEAALKNQIIA